MSFNTIIYEKKERLAYVTLNRPDVLNAINQEMRRELAEVWTDIRNDPEVWVAIVTGAGDRAFSAGADLKDMASRTPEEFAAEFWRPALPALNRGLELWKPVIAAVNGLAVGGGLEIALASDIRIASENARFGLMEVLRGILPGGGGTQRLPRAIPLGLAMEMLLTGDLIDAQEAYRVGLVNRVVPRSELLPEAEKLANKLCYNSAPLSVRAIKEAAMRGLNTTLEEGLRIESLMRRIISTTDDSREGPRAFSDKRKPNYKAR